MNTLSFRTNIATPKTADKQWVVVDATDQILGRFSAKVAKILRGKYKEEKVYLTFSGYPSGQHKKTAAEIAGKKNGYERILRHAIKGMLPKNHLGAHLLDNLRIYEGPEHEQAAQQPKTIDINLLK